MTVIADCLRFAGVPERISEPAKERFVTVKLNGGGAVERQIGSGKTPVPFTGYRVRPGQFIYSRIDARNGAFAIVPAALEGAVVSKDFPVFDVRSDVAEADYLRHFFLSGQLEALIRARSRGATNRQRIKEDEFLGFPLQLPPLPEQRRIAAILDHADALRAKRRQVLAHLDSLTQSIFHDMFRDIAARGRLGDVAQVQGGLQVSSKRQGLPLEVPYLRVANVYRGRLELTEVKTIQATPAEVARTTLEVGDLLFVEGHANPLEVGRVAHWNGTLLKCVHQNHLIRARVDESVALPQFLSSWFNSDKGAAHFRQAGRTTSGLNTISASTVRTAPVPLPSLDLQQEFVARIRASGDQHARVRRAMAQGDQLFASLQSRAFRGDL